MHLEASVKFILLHSHCGKTACGEPGAMLSPPVSAAKPQSGGGREGTDAPAETLSGRRLFSLTHINQEQVRPGWEGICRVREGSLIARLKTAVAR
ncbi:uncharacterized [Tachysurus ichikawai]